MCHGNDSLANLQCLNGNKQNVVFWKDGLKYRIPCLSHTHSSYLVIVCWLSLFSHFFLPVSNPAYLLGGGRSWNLFLHYRCQVLCLFLLPLLFQIPADVWVSHRVLLCLHTVAVLFGLEGTGLLCRAARNRFSLPIFCWREQFTRGRSECKGVVLFSSWPPVLSGGWAPFERRPRAGLCWNKNGCEKTGSKWAKQFPVIKWNWSNMPGVFSIMRDCGASGVELD